MARTNYVKSYRGQTKCQYSPEGSWHVCGKPKAEHTSDLDHPFTQSPLRCESCGKDIEIGTPYKWVAPRAHRAARGVKRNRHTTCPAWKQSELTSSQHLATIYAAQEAAEDALSHLSITDPDDASGVESELGDIASEFASSIEEAVYSYEESAQAIEEGFGHETYQSQELMEKSEAIQSWKDEVESWQPDSFDGEIVCAECELVEADHDDSDHEYDPSLEPVEEWLEEQRDDLTDLINEVPV